jgi:hypothetical protein
LRLRDAAPPAASPSGAAEGEGGSPAAAAASARVASSEASILQLGTTSLLTAASFALGVAGLALEAVAPLLAAGFDLLSPVMFACVEIRKILILIEFFSILIAFKLLGLVLGLILKNVFRVCSA